MADERLQRLADGFGKFGYTVASSNAQKLQYEFSKPDSPLSFTVIYGEGGAALIWKKLDTGGVRNSFRSREGFWEAVAEILEANK